MKNADEATNPLEGLTLVTEPSAERLNERQQIDYRHTREQCLEWLLTFGKDPQKAEIECFVGLLEEMRTTGRSRV
jgi:hypothetical protein